MLSGLNSAKLSAQSPPWKINSWRGYPVKHIPDYPDKAELDQVLNKIRTFPPLVLQVRLDI